MKSPFFLKPEFKIGSHRGIQENSKISQNSIKSLELMHKKKADFYECDIVMTLDEKHEMQNKRKREVIRHTEVIDI